MKKPKRVTRVDALTDEQQAMLEPWRDKWIAKGLATGRTDWKQFETHMDECYRYAGLEPPTAYIRCGSPLAAALGTPFAAGLCDDSVCIPSIEAVAEVMLPAAESEPVAREIGRVVIATMRAIYSARGQSGSEPLAKAAIDRAVERTGQQWSRYLGGQLWAWWPAYTSFFVEICGLDLRGDKAAREVAYRKAMEAACWSWPHRLVCVVSARPVAIRLDDERRLHAESALAIEWPDGWGFASWHGTRVPTDWILQRDRLAPETALTWPNIEQRRAAAEIIGWHHVLERLPHKVIDADRDPMIGSLIEVRLPDADQPDTFLRVHCPTGRDFALCVSGQGFKTALEAQSALARIPQDFFKHLQQT